MKEYFTDSTFELEKSKRAELFQASQDLQGSDVDKVIGFIMGVNASKTLSQNKSDPKETA